MSDVEKICGIQCIANPRHTHGSCPDFLSRAATEPVRHLHQSIPAYNPTPLTVLPSLAQMLGIGAICIKDESKRFGLNAFKGLGGTYALCRVVCDKLGLDYRTVTLEQLQMPCFFQPHRSFIVNLDHVSSFDHSLIYLCNNQYRAYLTRRKYTQFKDAFLLYLESRR